MFATSASKLTLLLAASMMALAAVISSALPALAQGGEEILFFLDDPSTCPSAAFPGGSASMTGCATVTSLQATGTPQHSGDSLLCFGCTINFETGPLTGSDPTDWFFGAGGSGSVVMAGMIEDKNGDTEPPPGPLLTGALDPSTVTEADSTGTFTGHFTGTLSSEGFEELNEFYGITSMVFSNSITLKFGLAAPPMVGAAPLVVGDTVVGGGPFTSNPDVPFSGTVVATPVPEPQGAFLLGFSLLTGLMFFSLRHRRTGSA